MRTAQAIEESKAAKVTEDGSVKSGKRKMHPNSLANLVAPWQPGQSGNVLGGPTGPRKDVAADIARQIFENNSEAIYAKMAEAILKGNAYAFKEIAERAFGKLKERKEISGPDEGPVQASILIKFIQPDAS